MKDETALAADKVAEVAREFAPCPTCKQYDHSIHGDKLAEAFMHFEMMFSHRGDGIPTQHCFDQRTRDMAQVLVAGARTALSALPDLSRLEGVDRLVKAATAALPWVVGEEEGTELEEALAGVAQDTRGQGSGDEG